ncbi:hypothetical protein, partial [Pseudomonas sp. 86_A]|uniref:hypothetical protein n=1 Tax=Pseudomonas sp. 86_A TaxID=2813569 RepID=UPI001AA00A80
FYYVAPSNLGAGDCGQDVGHAASLLLGKVEMSLMGNFMGAQVANEGTQLDNHNDHCNHAGAEKGHEQNHSQHRIILDRADALKYQSGQMFLALFLSPKAGRCDPVGQVRSRFGNSSLPKECLALCACR